MKKRFVLVYVISIHILLTVVLLKCDFVKRVEHKLGINTFRAEITEHFHRMLCYHSRMDGNVPNKSVIFIGDSITQGLVVSAVVNPSVNYGIGSDTTVGVLQRLPVYKSVDKAIAVVIAVGINDMMYRSNEEILHNLKSIADKLPKKVPLVFSDILPVDEDVFNSRIGRNKRIKELNLNIKAWIATTANSFFVDIGPKIIDETDNLSDKFHDG
ncbi:MAG: hypothetical protein A4E74_00507 [Syntrophus sp. PtaB.Bin075]|nr:MAG: hypothetical protein A4E74_00507 [Syntrophus sp. PtaB.Bin075]